MIERPILFSAPMVRAILDGSKTQTRRILKLPLKDKDFGCELAGNEIGQSEAYRLCPYGQIGDRLWVRETCRAKELSDAEARKKAIDDGEEKPLYGLDGVFYTAGAQFYPIENSIAASEKWMTLNAYRGKSGAVVPGIHMPRWASRITLGITGVRVERLQNISERDAIAEGIERPGGHTEYWQRYDAKMDGAITEGCRSAIVSFSTLWDKINAKRAPWDSNPWVWVVEFRVIL